MMFIVVIFALLLMVMIPFLIAAVIIKKEEEDNLLPTEMELWQHPADDNIDIPAPALHDQALKYYVESGNMLHAIETYQMLTGASVKEARNAVFYMARLAKAKGRLTVSDAGAGIRDLLAEGRIDEAIKAYRVYNGVDEFTARDAVVDLMQHKDTDL
jgi:hypothetical protein